jgi:hypothetical protein
LLSLAPETIYVITDYNIFESGVSNLARGGRAASAGALIVP